MSREVILVLMTSELCPKIKSIINSQDLTSHDIETQISLAYKTIFPPCVIYLYTLSLPAVLNSHYFHPGSSNETVVIRKDRTLLQNSTRI